MIVVGVYKHSTDEFEHKDSEDGQANKKKEQTTSKPYVWISPPKGIELNVNDELFVLSDTSPEAPVSRNNQKNQFADTSKLMKNQEKKIEESNI